MTLFINCDVLSSFFAQRCGTAGHVIRTEPKSDGLKRHRHDIGDLRRVLSRGTRRRRRSLRARSPAACVASSLAAARNRCIYVGDSCQRYLACEFLRLKDPKDGVNILAVYAPMTDWRGGWIRHKEPRPTCYTCTLELDHVSKMNKYKCLVSISTILLRKKAQETETA